MYRVLALLLLVVVGCNRADVVIVPEEIDVCPVLADQLENLLVTIIEFAEEATIDELTAPDGMAADLRRRGEALSQRAVDLGCDAAELRSQLTPSRFASTDPVASQFVELVLDSLQQ
ncbi:MAG: hypothetical protein OES13_11155 [Acidimicrobiia bacterium]|nr:hypothetical protein [Acidimicrobiia bacterium]